MTTPTYHQFKAVDAEFNAYIKKASDKMQSMLAPYRQDNGFVGKSVKDSLSGFRAIEAEYNQLVARHKAFIASVPLNIRKKYQRKCGMKDTWKNTVKNMVDISRPILDNDCHQLRRQKP